MGDGEPKQFRMLGEEPVFCHSVLHFGNHPLISRVIVVGPVDLLDRVEILLEDLITDAPVSIVAGGELRQDSVYAGISAAEDCELVAVHDGARPFPPDNLEQAIDAARQHGGAIFAVPATDSLKLVDDTRIRHTVPRENMWAAQTPQVFQRDRLMQALEQARRDNVVLSDEASAFELNDWPVEILNGSRYNIKLTYPEDFIMAEAILKGRQ